MLVVLYAVGPCDCNHPDAQPYCWTLATMQSIG